MRDVSKAHRTKCLCPIVVVACPSTFVRYTKDVQRAHKSLVIRIAHFPVQIAVIASMKWLTESDRCSLDRPKWMEKSFVELAVRERCCDSGLLLFTISLVCVLVAICAHFGCW